MYGGDIRVMFGARPKSPRPKSPDILTPADALKTTVEPTILSPPADALKPTVEPTILPPPADPPLQWSQESGHIRVRFCC